MKETDVSAMDDYSPEIRRLLTYGRAESTARWPDYVHELALNEQHVPELISVATDRALYAGDAEFAQASAPAHAWRALGQLHAAVAVEPLLSLLETSPSDWTVIEIPETIGMMGRGALPALTRWIEDESRGETATYGVIKSLTELAKRTPELANAVTTLLSNRLAKYPDNDFVVNAYLVEALCALRSKEALPLITEVYSRQRAAVTIFHWDQVLEALEPET